jgi:hypothetical protein
MCALILAHFMLLSLSSTVLLCVDAQAESLPKDAQVLVDEHDRDLKKLKESYEQEVRASADRLISNLKNVRDAYTKPGSLKQAMAIQDQIQKICLEAYAIEAEPTTLANINKAPGESMLYFLTGSNSGPVWGSDVYSDDSSLSTAAVHAGVLKDGESGSVKVTVLEGKPAYEGSNRSGITTQAYGPWSRSFKIERYQLDLNDD